MDRETREQLRRQRRRAWFRAVALLTVLLLAAAIPVSAWLSGQRRLAAAAKIERSDNIEIVSGGGESHHYIDINTIDATKGTAGEGGKYMDFVFGVKSTNNSYHLQLTHTTNNPYTYKVYPATDGTPNNYKVPYTTHETTPRTLYYTIPDNAAAIPGSYLNAAEDASYQAEAIVGYHEKSYDGNSDTAGDNEDESLIETHAEPLVWQTTNKIQTNAETTYYILRVIWPTAYSENTRETDILYISAYAG